MVLTGKRSRLGAGGGERTLSEAAARLPAPVRQARIAAAFRQEGYVGVAALARELGVSNMTIRRDIAKLERNGLLKRTHGGAVSAGHLSPVHVDFQEPPFPERAEDKVAEKSQIARAAMKLITRGQAIGLDVGTSILALADLLAGREDLRIVTNSIHAAMRLAGGKCTVYLSGGQVRSPEMSVVGADAVLATQTRFLDQVFLGISGIDASGCYDYSPEDSEVKRAYAKSAERVNVLCDSSKFNKKALSPVLGLDGIDCLVTDVAPTGALAVALDEAGVDVVLADPQQDD